MSSDGLVEMATESKRTILYRFFLAIVISHGMKRYVCPQIIALRAEIEDKLQQQGKMSNEMLSLERAMGLLQSDNATLR